MKTPINVTEETFKAEVLKSTLPVLVEFFTEWCLGCRMIAPLLVEIARELNGQLKIYKVNIESEIKLASEYGITVIPTLLLFKDGLIVATMQSANGKRAIVAMIEPYLKPPKTTRNY